jgi:Domain of unknown function (DUF4864)
MRRLLTTLIVFASLTLASLVPVQAAGLSEAQQRAVQAVVQSQLDAFGADDAPRAFSFASQGIRNMFGTPEQFMAMVRSSYPVVYRPASVRFLKARPDGTTVLQPVQMNDAEGQSWLAIYRLELQKDKTWRIAGCVLAQGSAQST